MIKKNEGAENTPDAFPSMTTWRIVQEVKKVAKQRYDIVGDPLKPANRTGTYEEELLIQNIVIDSRLRLTGQAKSLVKLVARRIVLNRRRDSDD